MSKKTELDFELESLAQTWQEDTGPNLEDVQRDMKQALTRARAAFAIEMLIVALGTYVGLRLIGSADVVTGIAATLFSLFGGALSIWTRVRLWRVRIDDMVSEMSSLEAEARNEIRAVWAGIFVCGAAVAFLAMLVLYDGGVSTHIALLGAAFIAGGFVYCTRLLKSTKQRLDQIRELRNAYSRSSKTSSES